MQQPMLWGGGFYGVPSFYSGSVYQATAPCQHRHYQFRPPNSGPSCNRRRKQLSRQAEPQYNFQLKHESAGTVFYYDRFTGVYRCHASNAPQINPRIGKVWRTPPRTPFIADCNLPSGQDLILVAVGPLSTLSDWKVC